MTKICLIALSLLFSKHALAAEVLFNTIEYTHSTDQLNASPKFSIEVNKPIEEAINNGIIITVIIKIKSIENIDWWFDHTLESQKQTFEVRYFSLSGQYQLKNTTNESQNSFVTLNELWLYLADNSHFLFTEQINNIDFLSTRFMLDTGALPSTMQLPVLFDSAWDMNSSWQQQKIQKPGVVKQTEGEK